MDFIVKLGIDWKLFGAQLVNFAILLIILHRFLYKPVINLLDKRKKEIESNAKKTSLIEQRLITVEKEVEEKIKKAEKDAQTIIHESRIIAAEEKEKTLEEAERETKKLIESARKDITKEKEEAMQEVLKESEELIKKAVLSILDQVGGKELAKSLEKRTFESISKVKQLKS